MSNLDSIRKQVKSGAIQPAKASAPKIPSDRPPYPYASRTTEHVHAGLPRTPTLLPGGFTAPPPVPATPATKDPVLADPNGPLLVALAQVNGHSQPYDWARTVLAQVKTLTA